MMTIKDVLSFVRPHLLNLQPYSSARDEFDPTTIGTRQLVFLDANENPFETGYNRYPDPHHFDLKKKISSIKKMPANQIFLGNGSDEAIDLIIRLFCSEADTIVIPTPTYGMYEVSAKINNIQIKKSLLDPDFNLDEIDVNQKLIFLCSPNNPTGNLLDIQSVLDRFKGIVVVDEAYIDFSSKPSFVDQISKYSNLIVLQTFSKAWGLAGLRLGMAFAQPEIIALLNKIKSPYNISITTQKLALQALAKEWQTTEWVASIKSERSRVAQELTKLTSVKKVFPSETNFLLVRIDNAADVYDDLIDSLIVVRDRSQVARCADCLRITIGTPGENDQLLDALRKQQ